MIKKKQIIVLLLLAVMLAMNISVSKTFAADVPDTPVLKSAVSKSYNSVKITWEKVSKAEGYYVYRKVSGGSWERIAHVKSGSTVTYTDSGLTCGTEYTYTVKAYFVKDDEKVFGSCSKTGISCKPVPSAPSLESAKSASYTSIKLTWEKVSGADGYYVYRKGSGGSWERIREVKSGTALTDKGLECGTTYTYTVRAYRLVKGNKVLGNYSKTGISGKPVPSAPSLKSAVSQSYRSIKLTWSKVDEADGYYVYRKESGGSWERIKEVKSGTSLKDTDLTCGTTYTYTVKAYRIVKNKKITGNYSKAGISGKPVPAAPVLKSAKGKSYTSIKLTWEKVSGASGYYVYHKFSGGSWDRVKRITSGSTTTYTDTGLESGTAYTYTVKAYRTVGDTKVVGKYDKTGIDAETLTLEATSASIAVNSDTRILVKWKRCDDVDGYQVWRSTTADSGYTLVKSTENLKYLDTSLVKGMTYYYKVRSYKVIGSSTAYGAWSDAQGTSLPAMYNSKKVITPLENGTNIYIAGDSTTRNYAENGINQKGKISSHGSWGEYLQDFFDSEKIQVNNYGVSNLSTRSFINRGWLDKISSTIQSGDYLLIQFGHNDREADSTEHYTMLGEPDENGIYPVTPGEKTATPSDLKDTCGDTWYAQDTGTYKWYLYQYVDVALNAGATPVLVTPVSRLVFNKDGTIRCHHDPTDAAFSERKDAYVTAMKQVYDEYRAKGETIYLIDMYSATKNLYENAYQADSDVSGTTSPLAMQLFDTDDFTHNSKLGGFILAAQMAVKIQKSDLGIAGEVKQPKNVTSVAADNHTPAVIVDHLPQFTGYALTLSGDEYTAKKSPYWIAIGKGLISELE